MHSLLPTSAQAEHSDDSRITRIVPYVIVFDFRGEEFQLVADRFPLGGGPFERRPLPLCSRINVSNPSMCGSMVPECPRLLHSSPIIGWRPTISVAFIATFAWPQET